VAFEIGKIDSIESHLVRRLEDDGRRADRWLQRSNRASPGLSQAENHVHGLTVYRASRRPGQAYYHHHRPKNPAAYADLVEPAPLQVLDAHNLYRDIVQELEEGGDCLGQKAYFESDHSAAGFVIRPASPSLI
jgi:hypothetical protein